MDQNLFIDLQKPCFREIDTSFMFDAIDEADSVAIFCGEYWAPKENRGPIWWCVFQLFMYGA